MATRYIPLFLRHSPTPRVEAFALLAGLEAGVRGILISVMPLVMYEAVQDAAIVSRIYFVIGIASLVWGLLVPWVTHFVPRRWVYTLGTGLYLLGMVLALVGGPVGDRSCDPCQRAGDGDDLRLPERLCARLHPARATGTLGLAPDALCGDLLGGGADAGGLAAVGLGARCPSLWRADLPSRC